MITIYDNNFLNKFVKKYRALIHLIRIFKQLFDDIRPNTVVNKLMLQQFKKFKIQQLIQHTNIFNSF